MLQYLQKKVEYHELYIISTKNRFDTLSFEALIMNVTNSFFIISHEYVFYALVFLFVH